MASHITGLLDLVDVLHGDKLDEKEAKQLEAYLNGCLLPVVFFCSRKLAKRPLAKMKWSKYSAISTSRCDQFRRRMRLLLTTATHTLSLRVS